MNLKYAAFDLLYLNGQDVTGLPLGKRRALLQQLLTPVTMMPLAIPLSISEGQMAETKDDVNRLFHHFRAQGYEGIIAKYDPAFEPKYDRMDSIVPTHYKMLAYHNGELGKQLVPLPTVDRIIAIGSDRMMAAVKAARHGVLEPHLKKEHVGIGSINSPMQCMMKEVCAQCLQKHVDPVTGKEEIIFSCFNQDQELDRVDFPNLAARLRQNTVQEKLASLWLDHLLRGEDFARV